MTCDTAGWETRSCWAALAEASRLHDREKYAQIPQPQAASDVVVPIGYLGQKRTLSSMKLNRDYRL